MDNDILEDCGCGKPRRKRCCGEYILGILFVALAVVIGLIIGAIAAETILAALSALIILAIMLGILIIIRIISLFCRTR